MSESSASVLLGSDSHERVLHQPRLFEARADEAHVDGLARIQPQALGDEVLLRVDALAVAPVAVVEKVRGQGDATHRRDGQLVVAQVVRQRHALRNAALASSGVAPEYDRRSVHWYERQSIKR